MISRILLCSLVLTLWTVNVSAQQKKQVKKQRNRNPVPDKLEGGRTEIFKTVGDVKLKMFIFEPKGHKQGDKRPAIVFYFGGGWRNGSPRQFHKQCRYLASRGMVAMTAEYRVANRHQVKAVTCVSDAKSAMRWARKNADRLGIDPNRIAAGGGSAGGHLAAAVGTLDGFNEKGEDTSISARPNAMLLFNPAVDLTPEGFNKKPDSEKSGERSARFGIDPKKLSPTFHIRKGTPPTIIFHGQADPTVPFAQAVKFSKIMEHKGNRCEFDGYKGEVHGFFNWGRGDNKVFASTMRNADRFLVSLGYLHGKPTINAFVESITE